MLRLVHRALLISVLAVLCSLLVIPAANAYIDPGTGSMVFQAVIAGVMAAGLSIKLFWRRIVGFFKPSKESAEQEGVSERA